MKKIIPFRKDIIFKTNVSEIASISLEHTLQVLGNNISGEFIVSGDYKITDTSIDTEPFTYSLPFDISLDEKYDLSHVVVDIDDFYYEIIDDKVLQINIDVLIDHLEEKLLEQEELEEVRCIEEESPVELQEPVLESRVEDEKMNLEVLKEEKVEEKNILLESITENESYSTYRIYIVREGDSIESILQKYDIPKGLLEGYNDLKDVKIGDKIIIPTDAL